MIEILSPLAKGLMQLTGVLSIGLLIAIAFLDLDLKGKVLNSSLIKKTRTLIYSWLAVTFIYILIQIAYLLEQPLSASFDLTVIRSYLTQTSIGKSYLVQMILIVLVLLIPLKKENVSLSLAALRLWCFLLLLTFSLLVCGDAK